MTKYLDLQALVQIIGPRFAEGAAERDAGDVFVADHYDVLKQHKVFSALVPAELGGGGVSHSAMCRFLRQLAHYCPSTALALSMHQHLVAAAVYNHRNGKPGQKLLEKVAASEVVLISTGANDWMESSGLAARADGGFRINARKPFGSGSPKGGMLMTSAPFEDPKEGWQVLHFAVPFSAPGVSLANDWQTLGMRATGSQTIILENVFVPDDAMALRRPRGKFHPAWNVILTVAMPLIMSVYTGVAEAAADIATELARKRLAILSPKATKVPPSEVLSSVRPLVVPQLTGEIREDDPHLIRARDEGRHGKLHKASARAHHLKARHRKSEG